MCGKPLILPRGHVYKGLHTCGKKLYITVCDKCLTRGQYASFKMKSAKQATYGVQTRSYDQHVTLEFHFMKLHRV